MRASRASSTIAVTPDPAVQAVVRKWMDDRLRRVPQGRLCPEAVVATITEPLDGREATVRNRPSALTDSSPPAWRTK